MTGVSLASVALKYLSVLPNAFIVIYEHIPTIRRCQNPLYSFHPTLPNEDPVSTAIHWVQVGIPYRYKYHTSRSLRCPVDVRSSLKVLRCDLSKVRTTDRVSRVGPRCNDDRI